MDKTGNLLRLDFIDLKKERNFWKKADIVSDRVSNFLSPEEVKQLDRIYVEENLQVFRRGLSSAKTLMTLAKFNGIVCFVLRQIFGMDPISVNVNEARKSVGLKIISQKKGGKPTKEQVIEWVTHDMTDYSPGFVWPTKILKSGPRSGLEIILPECSDMADAYVIAKAGIELYT
jgi:hypothetical protein